MRTRRKDWRVEEDIIIAVLGGGRVPRSAEEGDGESIGNIDNGGIPSSGMSTTLLWSIVAVLVVLGALVVMILVINKTSSSSASLVLSTSISGTRTVIVTHTNSESGSGSGSKASGGATATAAASGAASSLAALSSMTAASISTLPMPTAAISDPNKTVDYIQSDWNWLGGGSQYLTFVEEPLDGSDIVLAIEYPKGSYSGSDSVGGGVGAMHLDIYGDTAPSRSIISYDLAFSEDFNFMAGGKLPGAFGGYRADHCTGGRMTTACFSLRLMWRTDGAGEVYGYIPTAPSQCEDKNFLCHGGNAISIERGSFNFTAGVWQTVTEVAVLNSDPKEDGTVANGELSLYLNDALAFSLTDVVFRTNASVFFSSFLISSFFGGSTANYESQGGFSYFKNFQFFSGSDPSDASGDTIAAAVNTTSGDDS
ncbi:hypothetical protein BCR35DRAFT_336084 [Leucosporidium creatinivorum]|uniref:Polysaccharide lyase 14 domain-containing protein n=1 Tax=Leucosporidium creatinivorum TaxID=106004 RepID=A0A1Y2CQR5_9BASI|nr:hypothetical protein BCR35DRAFT_336084 [Leucosporidium creatinivorum]